MKSFKFFILILLLGVSLLGCTSNNESVGEKEEEVEINKINDSEEVVTDSTQLVGMLQRRETMKFL